MKINNQIKYTLSFAIVFIIIGISYGQKPMELSLEDAVSYAFKNSPEILNAKLKVIDAKKQKVETRAIGLPKIDVSADYNYFFDIPTQLMPDFLSPAIYGVLANENLINHPPPESGKFFETQFGQKHNLNLNATINSIIFSGEYIVALKTSKVYEKFSLDQLNNVLKSVQDKTREAFLPALLIKENVQILNKNLSNLKKLKEEMEEMYKEGFVEQLDVDKIRLSYQNLMIEKENLSKQEDIVKNVLKLTIGFPISDSISINDDITKLLLSYDEAIISKELDYNNRADFNLLNRSLDLQKLNVQRYKSHYLPILVGFGSYSKKMTGNDGSDLNWYPTSLVGLKISFNIFNGLGDKAKIQRAKISLEMAENNLSNLTSAISVQVNNAKIAVKNAQNKLKAREDNLQLAEKIYSITKVKYKEGVGSSVELTQSEQSLYQAQANVIKSKYDLLSAKIKLKSALGF